MSVEFGFHDDGVSSLLRHLNAEVSDHTKRSSDHTCHSDDFLKKNGVLGSQ